MKPSRPAPEIGPEAGSHDSGEPRHQGTFEFSPPNGRDAHAPTAQDGTSTIVEQSPSATAGDDPFDPARLRLSQEGGAEVGVRKALLTVPIRKPNRQWFVRVHPDEAYRLQVALLELKEERESYLVQPDLCPELPGEVSPMLLVTAINRQGVVFLWPIRMPDLNGRIDAWSQSAMGACELAMNRWVRVASNMSLGAYDVYEATGELAEPAWPEVEFKELLRIGFGDRFITSLDHPVIRRLRGEI